MPSADCRCGVFDDEPLKNQHLLLGPELGVPMETEEAGDTRRLGASPFLVVISRAWWPDATLGSGREGASNAVPSMLVIGDADD
jgi:hypothetical protein